MARTRAWVCFVTALVGVAHRVPPPESCTVQDRARAWLRFVTAPGRVAHRVPPPESCTVQDCGRLALCKTAIGPGLSRRLAHEASVVPDPGHPAAESCTVQDRARAWLRFVAAPGRVADRVPLPESCTVQDRARAWLRFVAAWRGRRVAHRVPGAASVDFARCNMLAGGGRGMRRMRRVGWIAREQERAGQVVPAGARFRNSSSERASRSTWQSRPPAAPGLRRRAEIGAESQKKQRPDRRRDRWLSVGWVSTAQPTIL